MAAASAAKPNEIESNAHLIWDRRARTLNVSWTVSPMWSLPMKLTRPTKMSPSLGANNKSLAQTCANRGGYLRPAQIP